MHERVGDVDVRNDAGEPFLKIRNLSPATKILERMNFARLHEHISERQNSGHFSFRHQTKVADLQSCFPAVSVDS